MKKLNIVIVAGAVAVLAYMVVRTGWSGAVQQLTAVRNVLPLLMGLSLVRLALQTLAWSTALRAEGIRAGFGELILARSSSRGVGYLSVLGPAVAEPLRISMLRDRSSAAAAATLIDTGVYWFSSGLFAILGTICALHFLGGSSHPLPLIVMVTGTAVGLFFIARPKPRLPGLVRRLGSRCPKFVTKGIEVEAAMRDFQARHPQAIRLILVLDLLCQVLIAAEVVAIFACFGIPFHPVMVLALEAANRVVKMAGGLVPARMGTDESGMAAAFVAFGLPSASGLALALARRTRDLLEALLGIAWVSWRSRSAKTTSEPVAATQLASA